jgi:hypothetical protein
VFAFLAPDAPTGLVRLWSCSENCAHAQLSKTFFVKESFWANRATETLTGAGLRPRVRLRGLPGESHGRHIQRGNVPLRLGSQWSPCHLT